MKNVTSNFKEEIRKNGRQLDSKITINGLEFGKEIFNSITPKFNVSLFKTIMKGVEIDSNIFIPKNSKINVKSGVLVNNQYEYVDYGNYTSPKESEINEDTKSWKVTIYDKILDSMIDYDLQVEYPISVRNYWLAIFNRLNWDTSGIPETFTNSSKIIGQDVHSGIGYTFRDVLDELCSISGVWLVDINGIPTILRPNRTNETIDETYLSDTNVTIKQKVFFNSLVFSRAEESDNIFRKDDTSIEENGLHEYQIADNQLLSTNDRDLYIDELWEYLKTFQYYSYEIDTVGVMFLEPLDGFNIAVGSNTYPTILLNDETQITQGLKEILYSDIPKETQTEYKYADSTDKKINQAYILVDKQNLKIALKVDKDGVISAINLTPEEAKIKSGKISLEGYTTINGGFIVDEKGNATMNNAKINGGNIELVDNDDVGSNPALKIYNENQVIYTRTPLSVNKNLSGVKLQFEFPDIFEGTQTGVSLAFVNLVEFENGSLRYNYGYQYSSYINLYFYDNTNGNFTMIYTGDGISSPSINLKSITLPSNLGKITSINTDIKDTTNNKNLVDYIYYNVQQIGDRTEFNSDGVYIKRGDNYSYYSADGMIIKDENGTRQFTKSGITWMPPYGYNYIDFIVNNENILYGGRYLTTSENILWTRVVDQAEPYLELNLDNPVQGAIAYGVDVWASDKRLKDNISDSTYNALELVKKIKHRQFNYKSSSKKINIGYVADELEELDENLIFEVGKDKIKQPKESYIIPILSKAIQEMADNYDKKIAQLEEKIKILENKIGGK